MLQSARTPLGTPGAYALPEVIAGAFGAVVSIVMSTVVNKGLFIVVLVIFMGRLILIGFHLSLRHIAQAQRDIFGS